MALVDVHFALSSGKPCVTKTLVRFDAIDALSTVQARVRVAFLFIVARQAIVTGRISVVAVAFDRTICTHLTGSCFWSHWAR